MSVEDRSIPSILRDKAAIALIVAILGVSLCSILLGKLYSDVATLKKDAAARDAKMERLEAWFVQSMELASQRNADEMKILTTIASGQEKSVALLDFMAMYYKRAEFEVKRK